MDIAILLYDNMTALDAIGPYEVLAHVPGMNVRFVAKARGTVQMDSRILSLVATHALDDVKQTDMLLVPGGGGSRALLKDEQVLAWIREVDTHSTYTVSVCTGSLILAASGLLRGRRATSHWAVRDALSRWDVIPTKGRIVRDGKYVTCAGVSAGIDLGLSLVAQQLGQDTAKLVQLAIEYDPEPLFDCGSPEKAPQALVDAVRSRTPPVG